MHKSQGVVDKMAEAVEKASFVICCLSDDYKESKNCMLEFNYAHYFESENKNVLYVLAQKKFKPEGNIGIRLANNWYFNLSTSQELMLRTFPYCWKD